MVYVIAKHKNELLPHLTRKIGGYPQNHFSVEMHNYVVS